MKRRNPNLRYRLVRVADAFLPLALLACAMAAIVRPQRYPLALLAALGAAVLAVRVLALGSAVGVRIAFATQPSIRRVRGSVKCALLLQLLAGALCVAGTRLLPGDARLPSGITGPMLLPAICAGTLINIEHVFYEYLFAAGDGRSATLTRGIAALLTLAGFALSSDGFWLLPGMIAVGTLVSAVIGVTLGDGLKGRPNARALRCAPRALVQILALPVGAGLAAWAAARLCGLADRALFLEGLALGGCAGMALYALCHTPFRRARAEAKPLNLALTAAALLSAAGVFALRALGSTRLAVACGALFGAAVAAFALYGNLSRAPRD